MSMLLNQPILVQQDGEYKFVTPNYFAQLSRQFMEDSIRILENSGAAQKQGIGKLADLEAAGFKLQAEGLNDSSLALQYSRNFNRKNLIRNRTLELDALQRQSKRLSSTQIAQAVNQGLDIGSGSVLSLMNETLNVVSRNSVQTRNDVQSQLDALDFETRSQLAALKGQQDALLHNAKLVQETAKIEQTQIDFNTELQTNSARQKIIQQEMSLALSAAQEILGRI